MQKLIIIVVVIISVIAYFAVKFVRSVKKEEQEKEQLYSQHQLPPEKESLLAFGALLTRQRGEVPGILPVRKLDETADGLAAQWDINDSQSAHSTIEGLLHHSEEKTEWRAYSENLLIKLRNKDIQDTEETAEEVRSSINNYQAATTAFKTDLDYDDSLSVNTDLRAWDLERAAFLARCSLALGYITEDEAWSYINEAQRQAKEKYADWKDYFIGFFLGRSLEYAESSYEISRFYGEMFEANSLWVKYPLKSVSSQE
ncbi:DUF1266 domain-containing protein [Buttiauxella selenatireducens]|uniref:DUF1266 domain-containing protein n=1 Tax=Buttiauxella selenatireducens TaxID=3073902 RepID=A0ABY9S6C6_9ENTR|nr:DUF1266 domain-containing protein [Buttiauxella sp. R73]WMY72957.1 DUF1266 domain-containing protein [Buttiauxella sp. R73]